MVAPVVFDRNEDGASALLVALSALPPGHRDRPALRTRVIEAWLDWAHRHANRYSRSASSEDLRQIAAVGLINAVDGYDPAIATNFPAYAGVTIIGQLKQYIRDHGSAIRLPRRLQELILTIRAAGEELQQRLRRSPTVEDLATHLNVEAGEIIEALRAHQHHYPTSLHRPYSSDDERETGELLGEPDPRLESAADRIALVPAFAALPARERHILTLRFFADMTQTQIAAEVGISQMHVSRLITGALAQLRTDLTSE
jgi:RNA polymerase sigma-B factor